MSAFLLAAAEAATALVTSQWEPAPFPLRRLRLPSGSFANPTGKSHSELSAGEWDYTFKSRLEKRVGARGARLAHPTGTLAFGEAPSPGPT